MSTPSKETLDFLAEIGSEFGKKKEPKGKPQPKRSMYARGQVASLGDSTSQMIADSIAIAKRMDWRGPNWTPVARITWVVNQQCRCCGHTVRFIQGEYVRFNSQRERATIIRRAEVCSDLIHFAFGEVGKDLPDLIEEQVQTVARCVQCISEERQVEELWDFIATPQQAALDEQPNDQLVIPGLEDL